MSNSHGPCLICNVRPEGIEDDDVVFLYGMYGQPRLNNNPILAEAKNVTDWMLQEVAFIPNHPIYAAHNIKVTSDDEVVWTISLNTVDSIVDFVEGFMNKASPKLMETSYSIMEEIVVQAIKGLELVGDDILDLVTKLQVLGGITGEYGEVDVSPKVTTFAEVNELYPDPETLIGHIMYHNGGDKEEARLRALTFSAHIAIEAHVANLTPNYNMEAGLDALIPILYDEGMSATQERTQTMLSYVMDV